METCRDLLIILISSSLVSNVVLSQFLGLCPFLGVSKKVETAAGMGTAVIFVITLASAVAGVIYHVFTDDRVYSGNRGAGTVCGDGFEEIYAVFVQCTWCVSAADHDKLCSARCGTYKRAEKLRDIDRCG